MEPNKTEPVRESGREDKVADGKTEEAPAKPGAGIMEELSHQSVLMDDARKAKEIAERFMNKKTDADPDRT